MRELLAECADLEAFRRECPNLYLRVRGLFFLHALHRFHLPAKRDMPAGGLVPINSYQLLLSRRFEEAVRAFLNEQNAHGPSERLSSAMAMAYRELAFQTLADQVRASVRGVRGNQWMFRVGHTDDHPLRIRPELLRRTAPDGPFPVLREQTPVRMDLSHSAWSDIFFLGMDYPEGARVINVSIDLGVWQRDDSPRPPVEAYLRVIDEPVLRLVSVDLGASADLRNLTEVFDFARDYLGLLKAAVIASGLVPPGLEGSEAELAHLLARLTRPGLGLEIVSCVKNIPKGSRLAVSTNLLASLIAACMRATGQIQSLTGPLQESDRRLVAARAILGEWLGGSGGGWQDSGGVWPGIKIIEGVAAQPGDVEFGISRGRLLPRHRVLGIEEISQEVRRGLQQSLVLVHGGMAQNVGPVLQMVTEKYLLRSETEWHARQKALGIFDDLLAALRAGDVRAIGINTHKNFAEPIQTIIPWATNLYTDSLIEQMRGHFGDDFWGFWMLGGMSGGGMGFLVAPRRRAEAQEYLLATMRATKSAMQSCLPFAMEPIVYDFAINESGTRAELLTDATAFLPPAYYALQTPLWLRQDPRQLSHQRRLELQRFGAACRTRQEMAGMVETLFDRLLPRSSEEQIHAGALEGLLAEYGFDREQHERIRSGLKRGLFGLAQNRLPANTVIEDVHEADCITSDQDADGSVLAMGRDALTSGAVAVITLSAGIGSRWTQGAGVVKALDPFCKLNGKHRTFLEVHLAKSRRVSRACGTYLPHVITTGYLTHGPIAAYLSAQHNHAYPGSIHLSPGRAVGLRMVPMVRDLRFLWEEMPQQLLDEQAEKVRASLRTALIAWAEQSGEASDYRDNVPLQCLHPVGHWFEVANLLRNGVLGELLAARPQLKYLMVHNVDTLGASVDARLLGNHIASGGCLTYEVIRRRIEDRGGGLARVDGRVRLVEGLALPREEDELNLSFYNTLTTWVDVDKLLVAFGLRRADLAESEMVTTAVRHLAARVPTYITLKEVKKRWGFAQEDLFPVCQFEKLWGDMSAFPEIQCSFAIVPRCRGQQLKDKAQLDGWVRDGSAAYVESLCEWD
ncbi:MAG TPA: UTP--glucose-1-phosphate uridylyltransferase [Gemmataceae bacterium]|nr:UTP--glucose-1-phosphate uridylyltransferase [Gemmataceae bacterium]